MVAKIKIISLGGTIAMSRATLKEGAVPSLNADDLVNAVPQLENFAKISTTSFLNLPSANLNFEHLYGLVEKIKADTQLGFDGFVITQGTDTIEETSFALQLLSQAHNITAPIVVTGAMRHPSQISSDGSANLLGAVIIAGAQKSKNRGVLVFLNDEIHYPNYVSKTHSTAVQTFSSSPFAACGAVIEEEAYFYSEMPLIKSLPSKLLKFQKEVKIPILKPGIGEAPYLAEILLEQAIDGLIIEATGAGHVASNWVKPLEKLADKMPVILASRAKGRVLKNTYGYEGAEKDLINRGLIGASYLSPLKARVLLSLLVNGDVKTQKEVAAVFAAL